MTSQAIQIRDREVSALPFTSEGQQKYRDKELKGFLVVVGKRSKALCVESEYWNNGKRVFSARKKLGEFGKISCEDARLLAKDVLAQIAQGMHPDGDQTSGEQKTSLNEAWTRYRAKHLKRKNRSDGTIASYEDHMDRLFLDWLDLPLETLASSPKMVADRHDAITEEHGPAIANGAMRTLRAVYNHAAKWDLELPAGNPTRAVDWNPVKRRNTAMARKEIGPWLEELYALENPIRREFHLMTLLTASRPTALKLAKPEHIDFRERLLHIPNPKGGEDRAFDIPLSRAMIKCLIRVMRYGRMIYPQQAPHWLFPADGESGHLVEHKEDRSKLSKWGNDLRQTWRTIAQVTGISKLDSHLMMNHSIPGVNEGYITRDKLIEDLLCTQQEKISKAVIGAVPRNRPDIAAWVASSRPPELKAGWTHSAGQGIRIYTSNDPYHPVRKQRRQERRLAVQTA